MRKKPKSDPRQSKPTHGWVLVARDETGWYLAWTEVFRTRAQALELTKDGLWEKPFRAVRGSLQVSR